MTQKDKLETGKHQMKLIMENWKRYIVEQADDLNQKIALKIARSGLDDEAVGMSDKDLYDLSVSIYDKYFDDTREGWDPYPEDIEQIRKNLLLDKDRQINQMYYGVEHHPNDDPRW